MRFLPDIWADEHTAKQLEKNIQIMKCSERLTVPTWLLLVHFSSLEILPV